jgi:propanol-preferring alcohol dehydrogenase
MIAYRLVKPQEPPQLQDVPRPSPGSGQLLIKVGGCGLCHTDLGLMRRTKTDWADMQPPFTLGHEVAGWVAEIGPGVSSASKVASLWRWCPCGGAADTARHAGAAKRTFCYYLSRMIGAGLGFDGGLAEVHW